MHNAPSCGGLEHSHIYRQESSWKGSFISVAQKWVKPEEAQCLNDSRRLLLENFTKHLKGCSHSIMVLLALSLNFVSSWGKTQRLEFLPAISQHSCLGRQKWAPCKRQTQARARHHSQRPRRPCALDLLPGVTVLCRYAHLEKQEN